MLVSFRNCKALVNLDFLTSVELCETAINEDTGKFYRALYAYVELGVHPEEFADEVFYMGVPCSIVLGTDVVRMTLGTYDVDNKEAESDFEALKEACLKGEHATLSGTFEGIEPFVNDVEVETE